MRQIFALWVLCHLTAQADVLNLLNGDRFTGEVQLVNTTEIHVKTEAMGVVKIPRAKVASIFFGTNQPPAQSMSLQSAPGFDAKTVEQVQKEFLATATPEANAMFTELVQGLASGKINVNDIRKQASDTLKELRELQADASDEGDNALLKSYVGILEKFIGQGGTNRPAATAPKPAPPSPKKSDDE